MWKDRVTKKALLKKISKGALFAYAIKNEKLIRIPFREIKKCKHGVVLCQDLEDGSLSKLSLAELKWPKNDLRVH